MNFNPDRSPVLYLSSAEDGGNLTFILTNAKPIHMNANENLIITSDSPYFINGNGPQVLVFESITFENGAEMRIFSDAVMNVRTMTFMGNNNIRVLGVNGQNAVAGSADLNGGNGTNAPNVTFNVNAFSGGVTISVLAGNGGNGADGSPNGGNGGNAGNGGTVIFTYGTMGGNGSVVTDLAIAYGGIGGNGIQPANSKIQPQNGSNGANGYEGTVIVHPFN